MSSLWLDISEKCTGFSVMNDHGELVDFGSFSIISKEGFGAELSTFKALVANLLGKYEPTVIGIEDIFANNIEVYKKLSGLQAMALYLAYKYNKIKPILLRACSIRKHEKLNIEKVLTYDQWCKAHKNMLMGRHDKEALYANYYGEPKHYHNRFKHINFDKYKSLRFYEGEYYDIDNMQEAEKLTVVLKNGKFKILGTKITPFDYAKKIVIIDRVNKLFPVRIGELNNGKFLTYAENDIADAIYSNYVINTFLKEKK